MLGHFDHTHHGHLHGTDLVLGGLGDVAVSSLDYAGQSHYLGDHHALTGADYSNDYSTGAHGMDATQVVDEVFKYAVPIAVIGGAGCGIYRTVKPSSNSSAAPSHPARYNHSVTIPAENALLHEAVLDLLGTPAASDNSEPFTYSLVSEPAESRTVEVPTAGTTMTFGNTKVQRLKGNGLRLRVCFRNLARKTEFSGLLNEKIVELKEQTKRLDGESTTQHAHLFSTARTVQSLYEYISRSDVIPNLKASSGPIQTFCDFSIGAENRRIPHDVRFKLDYVRNNEPSTCIHFVKREDATVRAWVEQDEHDALTRFVAHVCGGPSNNIAQQ